MIFSYSVTHTLIKLDAHTPVVNLHIPRLSVRESARMATCFGSSQNTIVSVPIKSIQIPPISWLKFIKMDLLRSLSPYTR